MAELARTSDLACHSGDGWSLGGEGDGEDGGEGDDGEGDVEGDDDILGVDKIDLYGEAMMGAMANKEIGGEGG